MSVMIAELYDALKEAGASEEKAHAAAKTMADYENRFNKFDAELQLMKWMIGGCLALSGTVIGLLLNIVFKGVKTLP
ncbi:MAG: hypothetical protein QX192_06010 [Methylococcales bacterium]